MEENEEITVELTFLDGTVSGYSVNPIPSGWKSGRNDIKNIVIHDNVNEIGKYAFSDCRNLDSVIISNNVEIIDDYTFMNCISLKEITFSEKLKEIRHSAFNRCYSLSSINLPSSLNVIGKKAFSVCHSLEIIDIPNSVTTIGEKAFQVCDNLTTVNIGSGVKLIDRYAFSYCQKLSNINIPSNVNSIEEKGFFSSSTTNTPCEINCTEIGKGAFRFSEMPSASINSKTIGFDSFATRSGFTEINLTDKTIEIKHDAFCYCTGVKEFVIPNGVTRISDDMLLHCDLTSLQIPSSIKSIGFRALYGNTHLTTINFLGSQQEWYNIDKDEAWNALIPPTTFVYCSDGKVPIYY